MAKRRLTDLYVVGKAVTFDDGDGEPVEVYIRKLNPVEHETALKRANAARSRTLSIKNDPGSEDYQASWAAVTDYSREMLIDYLIADERATRAKIVEAELADREEWQKDAYLDGLQDAWNDGAKEAYAKDPTDPEARRVFEELKRFEDLVVRELEAELDNKRLDLESKSDTALQMSVFEKFLAMQASIAWLAEYRRCEVWLATREEDRKTKYFEDRAEVDLLPAEVYNRLVETYQEISVDPLEGKGLPATDISSPLSAPLESPETGQLSGPLESAL